MAQEIQVKCPTFVSEKNTIGCMAHIIHLAALAHANGPTQTEAQEPHGQMDLSNLIDKAEGLYLKYDSIVSQIAHLGSYLRQSLQFQEKFIAMVNFVYDEGKNKKSINSSHSCSYKMEFNSRDAGLGIAIERFLQPILFAGKPASLLTDPT
ncbi:hypothetical protein O181_132346 [Austropuccinia psidii MF-1]|uniref:Uncharacterized protein n=1 Tax=Austropuccinia psidii MF-1 TaxID=1389203 RepID=A0A9Q3L692_9BASI|nr:hypothetical protein [Austropuccinia psidii MF-1]